MKRPRILVVDDEEDIRDILKTILTEEGYEVIEACDGNEALKMAKTKAPDLIVLDYNIPYIDGKEVCSRLKRIFYCATCPYLCLPEEAR